jgi:hypothetical protein
MDQAAQSFSIKPLSSHTGAEIAGIDLRRPVDVATRAALNRAFEDHAVLAIRNQCLSAPEFLAAMQIFGDVFAQHNPRFAVPECPAIHYISHQDKLEDGRVYIPGEGYHTDHSNDAAPPKATALHAIKLPQSGGDTQFVNMCEAFDALPAAIKARIDGLKARHVYQSKHSGKISDMNNSTYVMLIEISSSARMREAKLRNMSMTAMRSPKSSATALLKPRAASEDQIPSVEWRNTDGQLATTIGLARSVRAITISPGDRGPSVVIFQPGGVVRWSATRCEMSTPCDNDNSLQAK